MAYAERIHPPLSRNMLTEELNRIRPALSRDSLPDMRESVMPALSDRLLNAPEATSAPQHHQAQQIPPRPPMPEHPTMRMVAAADAESDACADAASVQSADTANRTADPAPDAADAYARCARAENGAAFAGERVCADSVRFRVAMRTIPDAMWMRRRFCWAKADACCLMKGLCSTGSRRQATAVSAFQPSGADDRETITVDTARIDPRIRKIVFVLTIDEALTQKLHFGMLQNVYLRILDDRDGREILSYPLGNAFENVTSMTLGELYLHQGQWKFNPVGNGVHMDLAGAVRTVRRDARVRRNSG